MRAHIPLVIIALTLGAVLSGCTSFSPVYGTHAAVAMQDASFNFAPPTNRLERIIINKLMAAFPAPAHAGSPTLTVTATTATAPAPMSNAISIRAEANARVEATVTITQGETRLFSATRFADGVYQGGSLTPASVLSASGAADVAAASTAESLRAAILATYRPPTP